MELEKYKEMNNQMNNILPKHKKFTHRFLNGFTKRVFGTSHLYTEGLISFFRSIIRLNYYKCIGNYQNNENIKNISNYCKDDEKNIKTLGENIKIKIQCEQNKHEEIKLKYFFNKIPNNGYYLKKYFLNDELHENKGNEEYDKCLFTDFLIFLRNNGIDIEKIMPYVSYDNISEIRKKTSEIVKSDIQSINRSTKRKTTRRNSFRRGNQSVRGNCWAWASSRMILKIIQNIITYKPHDEILDVELKKSEMMDILHYNNTDNFIKELRRMKLNSNYLFGSSRYLDLDEDSKYFKNITLYNFCILLMDSYNNFIGKDKKKIVPLTSENVLTRDKETFSRGNRDGHVMDFLNGIKNIRKTVHKFKLFERFEFTEKQKIFIIDFFENFNEYMKDNGFKFVFKEIFIRKNSIITDDLVLYNKTENDLLSIINNIIIIIKKHNLYVNISLDLSTLPTLIKESHLEEHPRHQMVITKYSSTKGQFTIENSWGKDLYDTFVLTTEQLLHMMNLDSTIIFSYLYPERYIGIMKGYKKLSGNIDTDTNSNSPETKRYIERTIEKYNSLYRSIN
jgi:hypothetical protein